MTYIRHSWPLNSWGSLAHHTYCDKLNPFTWSSPRTRDRHTCYRAFGPDFKVFKVSCDRRSNPNFPQNCEANALPADSPLVKGTKQIQMLSWSVVNVFLRISRNRNKESNVQHTYSIQSLTSIVKFCLIYCTCFTSYSKLRSCFKRLPQ